MLGVLADNHYLALALDYLALLANSFNGRLNFHFYLSFQIGLKTRRLTLKDDCRVGAYFARQVILPFVRS